MSQDQWMTRVSICKDLIGKIDVNLRIAMDDLESDGTISQKVIDEIISCVSELNYGSKKRNIKGKKS